MMLKERTNRWARLRTLLVVPVMGSALYIFAQPAVKQILSPEATTERVTKNDDDSYWRLTQLFTYEAKKSAPFLKGKDIHANQLCMNKENKMLFNMEYIDMEHLPQALETLLYDAATVRPSRIEAISYSYDKGASEQEIAHMLRYVRDAYLHVRQRIATTSGSKGTADAESLLLMVVTRADVKNYTNHTTPENITDVTAYLATKADNDSWHELNGFTLSELKKEVSLLANSQAEREETYRRIRLEPAANCPIGTMDDVIQTVEEGIGR